ncbi:beta-N-acetylhexosaminidase [Paenibacillus athensensis]|uniref:Beta-N-acetylhexosaminidase n=1 Tax=Paenibacillus athensensis TaxID=1967502 RepID=A0A4Y8PZQ8_9BACL
MLNELPEELQPGFALAAPRIGLSIAPEGIPLRIEADLQSPEALEVSWDGSAAVIRYGSKHLFFRAISLLVQMWNPQTPTQSAAQTFAPSTQPIAQQEPGYRSPDTTPFCLQETRRFDRIGPMLDLSRNAVLTVDGFRELLPMLALMGMNTILLYMEDTYVVESEPYFGYMRGRYTQEELRAIDDCADLFGIEAIPCMQTLAHLEEFLKWDAARPYRDTKGALLVGQDETNRLVERMIEAVSTPFRSRTVHLGMDEAEELGRGAYLERIGHVERFELMSRHLDVVLDITRRKGLAPMLWSDMFLKLASATGSDYYDTDTQIPAAMANRIPKDATLVYWDYVHTEPEDYRKLIAAHRPLGCPLAFAGAVWIFNTFGVNYGLSLKASDEALLVCKQEGIREAYATLWGDDGNEGHPFAALLGLQLYAEHAYCAERPDREVIAQRVKLITGIDAEAFLLLKELDETPGSEPDNRKQSNPSKFLLYQDVLLGLFDRQIDGLPLNAHYEQLESKLREAHTQTATAGGVPGLFEMPEKLCAVLKHKSELGLTLKRAYDQGDRDALRHAARHKLPQIAEAVRELREAHRRQWLSRFKPFGWEVLDIRYGGVISRLESAARRLSDYTEGRIARIEELEQERLPYSPVNRFNGQGVGWCSYYYRMATPNVFFHVLNPF